MPENIHSERDSLDDTIGYISQIDRTFSDALRKHSRFIASIVILSVIILVIGTLTMWLLSRTSLNESLIAQLEASNRQISGITRALLETIEIDVPAIQQALESVRGQEELHALAIQELRKSDQQLGPTGESLLQVIGSAVILTLIGALGLQRLQNIDTEINALRQSVFTQAEARSKADRDALESLMKNRLQEQFSASQQEIRQGIEDGKRSISDLDTQASQILEKVKAEAATISKDFELTSKLLEKYPWLTSRQDFDSVKKLKELASVGQAHDLAMELNLQGDVLTAREALRQIIETDTTPNGDLVVTPRLPGDANDFHNSFSEAMKMEELDLAFLVVEAGLKKFPIHFDLVADKARIMSNLGRTEEAREYIERWRVTYPDEFTRSWRPVVFYVDLFDSLALTSEITQSLEEALTQVTVKQPYQIKPWAAYAELMSKMGNFERTEEILRKGLSHNPLSQQLNYALGQYLLKQGKIEEAVELLEKALHVDYQAQFQADVNMFAVWLTLAQAYEATGDPARARLLYQAVVASHDREAYQHLKRYASYRLQTIGLAADGESRAAQSADVEAAGVLPRSVLSDVMQRTVDAMTNAPDKLENWRLEVQNLLSTAMERGPSWDNEVALFQAILAILNDETVVLSATNPYFELVQVLLRAIEARRKLSN